MARQSSTTSITDTMPVVAKRAATFMCGGESKAVVAQRHLNRRLLNMRAWRPARGIPHDDPHTETCIRLERAYIDATCVEPEAGG
jgi:hypothetical protein